VEEKIDLSVSLRDRGVRLDVFLSRHLSLSRSYAARLIEDGNVVVDGEQKRPAFKVKPRMRVHGSLKRSEEGSSLQPCEIPLEILYEDEWIVVIKKPAGLVVHPGAGNADRTLVHALLARYPDIAGVGDPSRPGIVHRLDKLTSGVMVAAKNSQAHAALSRAFKAHEHLREYLAISYGHMPQDHGSIESCMQRHPRDRKRMTSKTKEGRMAITRYQVIRQWKAFSLLRLSLETGRTHQIRVHLSDLGHPVAGDAQYGGRKRAGAIADTVLRAYIKGLDWQMLHAAKLGITHPGTGTWMEFKADMPEDMQALIRLLDERKKSE
jgi:23S rRNA pseudouridine1911/1915/1917 synthase